ncbi:MAG: Gfo/Idh/MocA family protein [Lachnotalea sp.]
MKQVRIAVIGIGGMGKKYAQLINDGFVNNMTLTAVSCRSDANAKWAKDNLASQTKIFQDSDELFEQSELFDAVLIVTPHKTHPALATQAFEHKKHVFCDKPAGVSLQQSQIMNDAAKVSGMKYAMMFHQRLFQKHLRLKELLKQQELGEIKRIMLENSKYYRTQYYHESGSWRSSWNGEGGGALINQGQHILDIWQWLFGMPSSINANISFGKYNDFMVDDEATIYMQYPNHVSAVFILTTGEAVCEERLEIIGNKGKLLLENNHLKIWKYEKDSQEYSKTATVTDERELKVELTEEDFEPVLDPYQAMLQNFTDAILKGTKLVAPGEDGSNTLEIANAAYLSAWNNKAIQIPIDAKEYEEQLMSKMQEENKWKNER